MIYVGIYALIYLHTILGEGIVSRDGLPRGALPSGILKMEKYCPGHKVPVSKSDSNSAKHFIAQKMDLPLATLKIFDWKSAYFPIYISGK